MKIGDDMNKKGFTMIELLGVITILGILTGVAIPAVYRHVTHSKDQAYDTLLKTSYEAAASKAANTMADPSAEPDGKLVYDIGELSEEGYMDAPIDPNEKGSECTGEVTITVASSTGIESYEYKVEINCPTKSGLTKTFKTED